LVRQAKIEVTGGCFDFDPKIKKRKCLDFLNKKIKNYQRLFFFWIAYQKKPQQHQKNKKLQRGAS
jgi:hypothetical protein